MPVTSNSLFTGVAQSVNGGSTVQWANLANVLAEPGEASAFYNAGFQTWYMDLDTPDFVSVIPPDSTITNIAISISASMDGNVGITDVRLEDISIAGGLTYFTADLINTPLIYDITGDLAFWGITNQQALDFAAGSEILQFVGSNPIGSIGFSLDVQWAKVLVTYTSALIPVPTLF